MRKELKTIELNPEVAATTPKTSAEVLEEILKTNTEILESVKFIKNYFRWQSILSGIKIFVLVLVIILSLLSVGLITTYLQGAGSGLNLFSSPLDMIK